MTALIRAEVFCVWLIRVELFSVWLFLLQRLLACFGKLVTTVEQLDSELPVKFHLSRRLLHNLF